MKSGPGAFPGFKCYRTAVNSHCEKVSEIFTGSGVVALQNQTLFERETSRNDLWSTASYLPFLNS